ncbi:outer membrane beta-barrel protein [Ferruginibacter paludis]|uniref:outer membrane beta-barrel protein n=1 Tax=Ferruginibacter paludis TaxID=1310417 RepID=UPI0025B60954|nr:outer membrane beta-barrel protein [Ferruginibacter paludis]MDN3655775.1 outer membrane beta-barrel protein [Ferruginibacter paludis]
MKKVMLSAVILTLSVLTASAQKESAETNSFKFSVGVEGGLPTGDLKTTSSFGIGGSIQGDYKATESFALTLNAGYLSFSGKTVSLLGESIKYPSINIIPVLAGGKYYFTESVYGSAQVGVSFVSMTGESSSSAFTYAPGIGYYVSPNFDLLLKYQAASKNGSTLSFIGLRAAYSF